MKPTVVIAVDFDGVLHDYQGTLSHEELGEPIAGAIEWLHALRQEYVVAIHSCRSGTPHGRGLMREWLKKELPNGDLFNIYFPEHKPYAALYIDDKACRFYDWDEFPNVREVLGEG